MPAATTTTPAAPAWSYDNVDTNLIYSSTAGLIGNIGASSDYRTYIDAQQRANDDIQRQVSNYNVEAAKYAIDSTLQRDTDLLAQMNEAYNANRYIYNAVEGEKARLQRLDKQAKRDLQNAQQSYMMTQYGIRYRGFATGVMMFTTVATLLVLAPVSLWRAGVLSDTVAALVAGVLLFLYACVMVLLFRDVALRRSTNWDQYYWRSARSSAGTADWGSSSACGA